LVTPRRIVFAGTPEFARPALETLIQRPGQHPLAVLTQPDRPAGRGRKLTPSPVKQAAQAAGIEVLQPDSLKADSALAALERLAPDLIITAAYGLLLPKRVLDLPALGCWNLHASLLPRWRGASPIQQAILAGDAETGVTLMQMEAGLDSGPILCQQAVPIGREETAGELHDRLAELAAEVLAEALDRLAQDALPSPEPQPGRGVTHAPLIRKSDAEIDWREPAETLARQVRAFNPWPVAFGKLADQPVRIFRARALADSGPGAPGAVRTRSGLDVACGRGWLRILELQSPGRRRMPADEWLNAHPSLRDAAR